MERVEFGDEKSPVNYITLHISSGKPCCFLCLQNLDLKELKWHMAEF